MDITFQTTFASGEFVLDRDIRDVEVVWKGAQPFLLVTSGTNGGLSSYAITASGPALTDTEVFNTFRGEAATETLTLLAGGDYVLYATPNDGLALTMSVTGAGALGFTQFRTGFDGLGSGGDAVSVDFAGGGEGLYTLDVRTGALAAHDITDLDAPVSTVTDEVFGAGASLAHAGSQGRDFIVVTDMEAHGLSVFQVDGAPETLVEVSSFGAANGIGMNTPAALATIAAYGTDWVLAGSAGAHMLVAMELDAMGQLTATDQVMDTRATRFGGVSTLEVVEVDGQVIVFAAGDDDGISVFSLLPDGRLVLRDTIIHDVGHGLANIDDIAVAQVDGALQVFVSSTASDGLAWLTLDIGQLTAPITAASGARSLSGGAGDDILLGSDGGADTLLGGAGDDILVAGLAGGTLTGGAGADVFVLSRAETTTRITDFEIGQDRLDASALPFLRDMSQFTLSTLGTGVRLTYRDARIDIAFAAAPAGEVTLTDIFGGTILETPDRIPILLLEPGMSHAGRNFSEAVRGGAGNDSLTGGGGADTLDGGEGGDRLEGGAGGDLLRGEDGADMLWGGVGDDRLEGGAGDDEALGEAGNDTLMGGLGADTLRGGEGADSLAGEADADELRGGTGNDTLDGGAGGDLLFAEDGDDSLMGGEGDDGLWGAAGRDMLDGGAGDDSLDGGTGDDTLLGGTGNDTLLGGQGDDSLDGFRGDDFMRGGDGDDNFRGGVGYDTLLGEAGDDFLRGGIDADILEGGAGDDQLRGQRHGDTLYGGSGDDNLKGGGGNDVLHGNAGNDFLKGGTRVDELFGGRGDDRLFGNAFADTLKGGAGDDRLNAGGGADLLVGGAGNDVLKGGTGGDTFVFSAGMDRDTVLDFDPAEDLLQLDAGLTAWLSGGRSGPDILERYGREEGGDVVLDFEDGNLLRLEDVADLMSLARSIETS
ncbi:MAG: calcium-binding protein [Pseudomonadota bacterium]